MKTYQVRLLDQDGQSKGLRTLRCLNDDEALRRAWNLFAKTEDAEIWDDSRLIARLFRASKPATLDLA